MSLIFLAIYTSLRDWYDPCMDHINHGAPYSHSQEHNNLLIIERLPKCPICPFYPDMSPMSEMSDSTVLSESSRYVSNVRSVRFIPICPFYPTWTDIRESDFLPGKVQIVPIYTTNDARESVFVSVQLTLIHTKNNVTGHGQKSPRARRRLISEPTSYYYAPTSSLLWAYV